MNQTALKHKMSPKKRKLRAQSLYNAAEVKKFKSTINGQWDKYCFKCHAIGTHLFCTNCVRSYHITCIKKKSQVFEADRFTCEYCTESIRCRVFDRNELSKTLAILMRHLYEDGESLRTLFDSSAQCEQSKQKLINKIDLDEINAKVTEIKYHTLVAFLSDIYWLQHNYLVIGNADDLKCRILRQLVSFCENELYDIDLCSECYRNANEFPDNWFTMVCEHPHLLVWAKCDDAYWPAKAMATTNASNATQIYVRYFGGHRRFAYIGSNHCYLYSTIHPEGLHFEEIDDIHQHAISEVKEYVKNIMQRFGHFRYAAERVLLKPHRAIYQLKTMIPDINLHNKSFNRFFNSSPLEMVSPFVVRADRMNICDRPTLLSEDNSADLNATQMANLSNTDDFTDTRLIATPQASSSLINIEDGAVGDAVIDQHSEEIINILSDSDDEFSVEAITVEKFEADNEIGEGNTEQCTSTKCTSAENINTNSTDTNEVSNNVEDGLPHSDDSVPADEIDPFEELGGVQVPSSTTGPNNGNSSTDPIASASTSKDTQTTSDTSNENVEDMNSFASLPSSNNTTHNSTHLLNYERQSLIDMINGNFQAYDQKIAARDVVIRKRDMEIEALKKKLHVAEKNLKSVVTCFKEAKGIHKALVESCQTMENERKIQQQAYEALFKSHEQKVSAAVNNHLQVFDKLASLLKHE